MPGPYEDMVLVKGSIDCASGYVTFTLAISCPVVAFMVAKDMKPCVPQLLDPAVSTSVPSVTDDSERAGLKGTPEMLFGTGISHMYPVCIARKVFTLMFSGLMELVKPAHTVMLTAVT